MQTYIWIAGEDELEKGEWDFGEFMREKKKYWVGARDEYSGESPPSSQLWLSWSSVMWRSDNNVQC